MPHDIELPLVSHIFLSATAEDCKTYREAVQKAVLAGVEGASVQLQEQWTDAAQFVVDICERRVKSADAYVGLFGHRYGWIPPNFTYSITELEFRWATDYWKQPTAPIFILRPAPKSAANDELLANARAVQQGKSESEIRRDAEAQAAFLASVDAWLAGRTYVPYRDREELSSKALACILNWNLQLFRSAPRTRHQPSGVIPGEELGRIGRERQLRALEGALEVHRERNKAAAAFVIHGPENHGQQQFAEFLHRWDEVWTEDQVIHGQPAQSDDIDALIRWLAAKLREPQVGAASIAKLAATIEARLRELDLVVVLRSAGHEASRLARFQAELWQPLCRALSARRGKGRLYCFVLEHEPLAPGTSGVSVASLDANDIDYEQLLALPALGTLSALHVQSWLQGLKKRTQIELSAPRREEISKHATRNGTDGAPANIYERLAREGFWRSGL